jgi:hypothetical protein
MRTIIYLMPVILPVLFWAAYHYYEESVPGETGESGRFGD